MPRPLAPPPTQYWACTCPRAPVHGVERIIAPRASTTRIDQNCAPLAHARGGFARWSHLCVCVRAPRHHAAARCLDAHVHARRALLPVILHPNSLATASGGTGRGARRQPADPATAADLRKGRGARLVPRCPCIAALLLSLKAQRVRLTPRSNFAAAAAYGQLDCAVPHSRWTNNHG